MGSLLLSGEEVVREKLSIVEQELLKYALRSADLSVTATMVAGEFDIRRKYAWILLKRLMQKGVLEPAREGAARARTYRVSNAYIHRK
jgi:predicted transcriptional regulator